MLFTVGVNGVTSYFAQTSILDLSGGFDMDWRIYAFCFIALMFLITYFHVEIVAKILGIALIGELVILMIFSFAVVVQGGGPDGIVWEALNPAGDLQRRRGRRGRSPRVRRRPRRRRLLRRASGRGSASRWRRTTPRSPGTRRR